MIKARKGKIIFLSSVVAASGNAGQVNYCASKAGIEAMCKSIAREVAYEASPSIVLLLGSLVQR